MTKLHSLISVYGAIDQAAVAAKSPALSAKFAELLPGTTVLGNRGWYRQVNQIHRSKPGSVEFETLENALDDLKDVDVAKPEEGSAPDANTLTKYDLAKLHQTVNALETLKALSANENDPAANVLQFQPATLAAVRSNIEFKVGVHNLDSLRCECISAIREVNGEYCTVLLTDSSDLDLTVDALKDILDPLNWPKVNTFFQAIERRDPSPTGWGRMLEVVGTGDGGAFTLRTPLKYWKGDLPDGGVYLNYDMDDDAFSDAESDHLVVIDNGYIVATPTNPNHPEQPGVRLQTSKELLIRGMSPTAAATLACHLGWADAGKGMFFDTARLDPRPPGLEPWVISTEGAPPTPRQPHPPANWSLPATNRNEIITGAQDDANDLLSHAADAFGEFVNYWQDGLTPEDITKVSTTFGTELTRTLQNMFTNAVSTVKPATPGGPTNG
jgi:hypothetical protein